MKKKKKKKKTGDGDPLDICVLSTRGINHGDLLLNAIPIGGFRMIDQGEADDKVMIISNEAIYVLKPVVSREQIIAVIKGDAIMNGWKDVKDMPPPMLDMLKHFFLTYKLPPANLFNATVAIPEIYGAEEAMRVIRATQIDYKNKFGDLKAAFQQW
jgi:inorganic pyrophosphatase